MCLTVETKGLAKAFSKRANYCALRHNNVMQSQQTLFKPPSTLQRVNARS